MPEDAPLVEGAPTVCSACGAALCLRKQVINLALGNDEKMFCLGCLAKQTGQSAQSVLREIKPYAQSRECFYKEWLRYVDVQYCPDRLGCFPGECFS